MLADHFEILNTFKACIRFKIVDSSILAVSQNSKDIYCYEMFGLECLDTNLISIQVKLIASEKNLRILLKNKNNSLIPR